MAIKDYSTTASNNTALFPEGMNPGNVNNSARQVQADIREWYEAPEWRDYGNTPTYVSATSFTISGNVTARYAVGSRLKLYGTTMGTRYGTIATSIYSSPNTTITVTMDSGSITSNLSAVFLGYSPIGSPIPVSALSGGWDASDVSYDNALSGLPATDVQDAIDELKTLIDELTVKASQAAPTGLIAGFRMTTAPGGWVKLDNGTIGNAGSGATTRANEDCRALFVLTWNEISNTNAPIQNSSGTPTTRGASAEDDFDAGKRLPIEDWRAEFMRGLDSGRGVDSGRDLGTAQADEFKAHNHPQSGQRDNQSVSPGGLEGLRVGGSAFNTGSAGGAETRPRNRAALLCIKL